MPVELQSDISPNLEPEMDINSTLEIEGVPLDSFNLETHPKLMSLDYKIEGLARPYQKQNEK